MTSGMLIDQTPASILMVRPRNFGFDPETAASNSFQHAPTKDECPGEKAVKEFDRVVQMFRDKGVKVEVSSCNILRFDL